MQQDSYQPYIRRDGERHLVQAVQYGGRAGRLPADIGRYVESETRYFMKLYCTYCMLRVPIRNADMIEVRVDASDWIVKDCDGFFSFRSDEAFRKNYVADIRRKGVAQNATQQTAPQSPEQYKAAQDNATCDAGYFGVSNAAIAQNALYGGNAQAVPNVSSKKNFIVTTEFTAGDTMYVPEWREVKGPTKQTIINEYVMNGWLFESKEGMPPELFYRVLGDVVRKVPALHAFHSKQDAANFDPSQARHYL